MNCTRNWSCFKIKSIRIKEILGKNTSSILSISISIVVLICGWNCLIVWWVPLNNTGKLPILPGFLCPSPLPIDTQEGNFLGSNTDHKVYIKILSTMTSSDTEFQFVTICLNNYKVKKKIVFVSNPILLTFVTTCLIWLEMADCGLWCPLLNMNDIQG